MPNIITMPSLSPTMENGKISKWIIKVGDTISVGDYIADIETDKAIMEMESINSGVVFELLQEGDNCIAVGAPIAVILEKGEKEPTESLLKSATASVSNEQSNEHEKDDKHDFSPSTSIQNATVQASSFEGRVKITPIARAISNELNIDISHVSASGPNGRIRKADVIASNVSLTKNTKQEIPSKAPLYAINTEFNVQSKESIVKDMTKMQSVISKRMIEAKATVPHFYLEQQVRVDKLLKMRKEICDIAKVSINDIFIKACASTLKMCPFANVNYVNGDKISQRGSIDVSFAVGVEGVGVLTPVLNNVDRMNIFTISTKAKEIASEIRGGNYSNTSNQGSITISNLGMYGIEKFFSIINVPMPLGLAIGAAIEQPIVENGEIRVGNVVNLVLSVDHRVLNGVEAAQFMQCLKDLIENPIKIFAL